MQLLKRPFYYQTLKLNQFITKKILNYTYYPKFIVCNTKTTDLGDKTRLVRRRFTNVTQINKHKKEKNNKKGKTVKKNKKNVKKAKKNRKPKKTSRKKLVKLYFEQVLSEIYLATFNFIEYVEEDFFYKQKSNLEQGFSYKMKEKYFYNNRLTNHDFLEKTFHFNSCRNYLNRFYKSLTILSLKNKYKTLIPLSPKKGGFSVFGIGLLGTIKRKNIQYMNKFQLSNLILNSFYLLPTLTFFSTKLMFKFKKKGKKKQTLNRRLQFFFLNP